MYKLIETHRLKKKYVITFFILGLILSCLLCLAQNVTIITKPAVNVAKVMPLVIAKSGEPTVINAESNNVFYFHFPVGFINPLSVQDSQSKLLTRKILISDITITNVFGGVAEFHNLKIETRLVDILNTSHLLEVSLNQHYHDGIYNAFLMLLCFILIGFLTSFLLILCYKLIICSAERLTHIIQYYLNKKPKRFNSYIWPIALFFIFLVSALSIWSVVSGIIYADDGYFGLMASYPQDIKIANSTVYLVMHLLWGFSFNSVVAFRLLAWILNLISVCILSYTTSRLVSFLWRETTVVFNFILFALIYITSFFRFNYQVVPEYNNLSHLVVLLQCSIMMFLFVNSHNLQNRSNYAAVFILGCITGINLFIKFPEFFASIIFIAVLFRLIFANYVRNFLIYTSGIATVIVIYFIFLQSPIDLLYLYENSFKYMHITGGHRISLLLYQNAIDIIYTLFQIVLILLCYIYFSSKLTNKYSQKAILLFAIMLLSAISIPYLFASSGIVSYFILATKLLLFTMSLIAYENFRIFKVGSSLQKQLFIKISSISLSLLIFVYIASLGTDMAIMYHVLFEASFLMIIIIMQWRFFEEHNSQTWFFYAFLIVLFSVIFIKGIIFNSIRYADLLEQRVPYEFNNSTIYIDTPTNNVLNEVKSQLSACGYTEGDYIFGFYNMAGLIYAVGARTPITPWITSGATAADTLTANQFLLSFLSKDIESRIFVMVDGDSPYNPVENLFFDKFELCSKFTLTQYSSWPVFKNLQLYRHK